MGFQQGLSGVNAAAKAIDTTSNNIANSSTVGFKSANAQFSDMVNSSLGLGSVGDQPGGGVAVSGIRQNFTQGALTQTGNFLDMAISGSGFFEVRLGDGSFALTRNGQFNLDKEGFLVTATGAKVMGYQEASPDGGFAAPANPGPMNMKPLQVPVVGIKPQATTTMSMVANLRADSPVPSVAPFDMADDRTYNFSTAGNVFDSLGVEHTASFYYVRQAPLDANTWSVYASIDGGAPTAMTDLAFGADGLLTSGGTQSLGPVVLGNGSAPFEITSLSFDDMTQFSGDSVLRDIQRDGYASADLTGLTISDDGMIQGRYSNGESKNLGYVMVTDVRNLNGLQPAGDNLFRTTGESGVALRGLAGVGGKGAINAGAVEGSNVDLTGAMVDLIIQQRGYQANAQSIRTQDQLLQTMINLR